MSIGVSIQIVQNRKASSNPHAISTVTKNKDIRGNERVTRAIMITMSLLVKIFDCMVFSKCRESLKN